MLRKYFNKRQLPKVFVYCFAPKCEIFFQNSILGFGGRNKQRPMAWPSLCDSQTKGGRDYESSNQPSTNLNVRQQKAGKNTGLNALSAADGERFPGRGAMVDDMPKQPNPTRRDFPAFPFDPYPIQSEFMCFLYESLNKGGIAMLESPTGTGKTLSIICSALQWLVDRRNQHTRQNHECTSNKNESYEDEPDWMRDFTVPLPVPEKKTPKTHISKPKIPEKKIPKILEKIGEEIGEEEEREFLLEDYESEDEGMDRSKRKVKKCSGCDSSSSSEEEEELEQEELRPKIYFVSRTHSQLSQFVKEFKRTKFASEIDVVCLGSRKNLCINPSEDHFWT